MIHTTVALAPDEEIVHTIRRHWFHVAVFGALDVCVFLACVTAITVFDVGGTLMGGFDSAQVVFVSSFVVALIGLMLWMHFFAQWSDHWLDAWIITNRRVIDIEQKGFFSRQVSSFPLERIQDVTYDTHGIIATWLHFGDVRIQTASISSDFIMRQVPFPELTKEWIMEALTTRETPPTVDAREVSGA